jgi:hypothetical protein
MERFAIRKDDYMAALRKAMADLDQEQVNHLIHDFVISDDFAFAKRVFPNESEER